MGYVSNSTSQTVQVAPPTFQTVYYQGYFAMDTWQVTNKLTLNLGFRYEVPGVYVPRHGWADTFNPNGNQFRALASRERFDLVSSSQHPAAGVRNENWDDWSPRLGVAYRINEKTVFRGAWGKYIIPSDVQFPEAPLQAGINFLNNLMVSTTNGEQTPNNFVSPGVYSTANTLDNPYPNGLISPPHRNANYQQVLLGGNPQALYANEPNGETYQWNVAIERQLPLGIALEAAYSGLRGDNLPVSLRINPLADSVIAQAQTDPKCSTGNFGTGGCFLTQSVPIPANFIGVVTQGVLLKSNRKGHPEPIAAALPAVRQHQQQRPLHRHQQLQRAGTEAAKENVERRTHAGCVHLLEIDDRRRVPDLVARFDDDGGLPGLNNINNNYSLSSFDARQRLVVSYMYPLPIGQGQLLLHNLNSVANEVIGGWGLEGITTFQEGFPLGLSDTTNDLSTYAYRRHAKTRSLSRAATRRPAVRWLTASVRQKERPHGYFNTAAS